MGFVQVAASPMGHGFQAVAQADQPDALAPEAVLAALRAAAGGRLP